MGMRYEGTHTDSLAVYIAAPGEIGFDDGPNDEPLLMLDTPGNQFALAVEGDLLDLARRVNAEVAAYYGDTLPERVYDALRAAGHKALADEYADANGASK